jgi:threonine dehydrogenase-like Zn-dependent dehydrogenase
LELIATGQVHADRDITHSFPLPQITTAFETVESRKAIKVVIHPGERT